MESINLSEWYNPSEAAAVISRNSGKVVRADYVRKLAQYGKIRKIKINDRASLYWKADVDKYLVEERGVKSGRAKQMKAPQPRVSHVAYYEDQGEKKYVHQSCLGSKHNDPNVYSVPVNTLAPGTSCAVCGVAIDQKASEA